MKYSTTTIKEICNLITKGTTPTSIGHSFAESGIRFLRVQNISGGQVNFNNETLFIDEIVHNTLNRSQIKSGDLLITIAGTIGRCGIVPDDAPALNCNQAVAILRVKNEVHKPFLRHWLESPDAQEQIRNSTVTGTIQNLSLSQISSLKIPLPSLNEQRRIAAILDQADELRNKRREALAALDSLTQSTFIEMFGDPITNPKEWQWGKLGNVGSLDRGISKHRPRNAPELLGGLHPLVQTGEVANCDGYIRSYTQTYSDIGLKQSKLWPANTLCITIAANIAKTGILTFDACFPDSIVGFKAEEYATVEYVRVWLSFLQRALEASAPESAQKNINLAILRDLDIPIPPVHLQKEFAMRIKQLNLVKISHQKSIVTFDNLFASLQHRAFRGEL